LFLSFELISAPVRAEDPPERVLKWGALGTANGLFNYPGGIAIDPAGNVYVADQSNSRIQKFDADGHFLTKWGAYGFADSLFPSLQYLTVDPSSVVYVPQGGPFASVKKYSATGAYLGRWTWFEPSGAFPAGIAADPNGIIYTLISGVVRKT